MNEPTVTETLVVIPAFNEESSIGELVKLIRSRFPGLPVLVVDDGSRDNTAFKAREAGATVLPLPVNIGYGAALQAGYKYAWRNGFSFVVQLDADGQHDPEFIGRLLESVRGNVCDLAIGSRFLSERSYRVPFVRLMGIKMFSIILLLLTGRKFTDPLSGYQAMNRKTLAVFISDIFPRDYPDADMIFILHKCGLRVAEIPVAMRKSLGSKSMHDGVFRQVYYVFRMLLGLLVTVFRKFPKVT